MNKVTADRIKKFEFEIIKRVSDFRIKKNLTKQKLADALGISMYLLNKLVLHPNSSRLSVFKKVTAGLGLKLTVKWTEIQNEEIKMQKFNAKVKVSKVDQRRYVLSDPKNLAILQRIYKLEECQLSKEDKKLILFIRTQLKRDWQTPVIVFLNKLLKKYN